MASLQMDEDIDMSLAKRSSDEPKEKMIDLPTEYSLKSCYPNPFNPMTTIEYDLPEEAMVTEVSARPGRWSLCGRIVIDNRVCPGNHDVPGMSF